MNLLVLRFLTMNTEDEKRDQREAKLAAKGLVCILNFGYKYESTIKVDCLSKHV